MRKIKELTNTMWEELKRELFMNGTEALTDFLGFDIPENLEKDSIEKELDDIATQMPDDIQVKFYVKYVPNNSYVNDAGSIATVTKEMNQYVAYIEPDSKKIGPFDFRDEIIHELSARGFYEEEILVVH